MGNGVNSGFQKPNFILFGNNVKVTGENDSAYSNSGIKLFSIGERLDGTGSSRGRSKNPVNEFCLFLERDLGNDKKIKLNIDTKDLQEFILESGESENEFDFKFFKSNIGEGGKSVIYLATDEIIGGDGRSPLHIFRNQEEGETNISIVAGVFSGSTPKLNNTPITDDPRPTLALNSSQTKAWIKATWDLSSQSVTECEFEFGGSIPSNSKTISYLETASIIWDTESSPNKIERIDNFYNGSIAAAINGDAEILFVGIL